MVDETGKKTLELLEEFPWYSDWLVSFFAPYLNGEILEIGAGIGTMSQRFMKFGKLTALDINEEYVNKLKNRLGKDSSVGVGDIEKGKYFVEEKKYDTIVSSNVIEHIKDDVSTFKNIYKLLKKNGKTIHILPAHNFLFGTLDEELGHFRRYSSKSLKKNLENLGFKVEKLTYLNALGALAWFLNSRVLRKKLIPKNQIAIAQSLMKVYLNIERKIPLPFGLSLFVVASKK